MPRLHLAIAVAVFVLAVSPSPALADDEVLVPPDASMGSNNGSPSPTATSGVDLGLAPVETDSTKNSSSSLPDVSSPSLPMVDPGGDSPPQQNAPPPRPQSSWSPSPGTQLSLPAGTGDIGTTHIVRLPAPDPPQSQPPAEPGDVPDGNGYDLNINVANPAWGKGDLDNLKRRLGISADDAQEHCHVSINGSIPTDKTMISFQMSPNFTHTVTHVVGTPQSATVSAMAVCDMLPLPPNAGFVTQIGDKYAIYLQQVNCAPPPAGAHTMNFQYEGDGKGSCHFE